MSALSDSSVCIVSALSPQMIAPWALSLVNSAIQNAVHEYPASQGREDGFVKLPQVVMQCIEEHPAFALQRLPVSSGDHQLLRLAVF